MPKRNDIKSILIIGAGPIVIGQACEFDYSGTQATRALKEEGYRVILVNSNPATIMTDPDIADATYIEPLTIEYLEAIIRIEKPDAILPTVGGQTGLNLAMELHKQGILDLNNVVESVRLRYTNSHPNFPNHMLQLLNDYDEHLNLSYHDLMFSIWIDTFHYV